MKELIEEYKNYATAISRQTPAYVIGGAVDFEDIEAEALYGLCLAASRYDRDSKVPFTSYSYLRIRGAILDMVRKQTRCISINENGANNPDLNEVIRMSYTVNSDTDQLECYSSFFDPEEECRRSHCKELLAELLSKLSLEEQKVLDLIYFQGLTLSESRVRMNGRSRSYICRVHKRALTRLKQVLLDSGEVGLQLMTYFCSTEDIA